MKTIGAAFLFVLSAAVPAFADPASSEGQGLKPEYGFLEAFGGYGLQFGEQQFIPNGAPTTSENPLTNGYNVGVTAGWEFTSDLALIGNWEYASANSRNGNITNALSNVEGTIDYHTIAIGLRYLRHLGPGRIFGELGAGVILPFETRLNYTYAPAMSQVNVTGSGAEINEYNLGFGAYGQLGYQVDITKGLYVAAALRVKSFQSDNDGKQTRYENFLDFTTMKMITEPVKYDSSGGVPPTTYSVQDLRMHIALGYRL